MNQLQVILLLWIIAVTSFGHSIDSYIKQKPPHDKRISDAEFLRRTFIVITGRLPQPTFAESFLKSENPSKRAQLIDSLLASEGCNAMLTMRWGDMLRIKSEFPSKLWPNGVQAYNRWLHEHIAENTPYHQMVRELLLSQGSNFRQPAVNFYRAFPKRTPAIIYNNINLLFLGSRSTRGDGSTCFAQLNYKNTKEWKEEIVFIDTHVPIFNSSIRINDSTNIKLNAGTDWRIPYVNWLTNNNTQFAAVMANRIWYWIMGKGIVDEPDDWRDDNPPSNESLLNALTTHFIKNGYNVKALMREILNSDIYQSAAGTPGGFVSQRLLAEVVVDAIADITGISDQYISRVPEPFTFYPLGTPAIELGDATVSSPVLELFGRASRDISFENQHNIQLTAQQLLYLMNSSELENKIRQSPVLNGLCKTYKNQVQLLQQITLLTLSRMPTAKEREIYKTYANLNKQSLRNFATDIVWTQINSIEFLYNH